MTCCFFQRTGDLVAMRIMCEPPHPQPVVSGHDALLLILSGTGWGCAGRFHMPWKQSELGLSASEGNRVMGVASMRLLVPRSTCPCHSGHVHPQGGSFPSRGNSPAGNLLWVLRLKCSGGARPGNGARLLLLTQPPFASGPLSEYFPSRSGQMPTEELPEAGC